MIFFWQLLAESERLRIKKLEEINKTVGTLQWGEAIYMDLTLKESENLFKFLVLHSIQVLLLKVSYDVTGCTINEWC